MSEVKKMLGRDVLRSRGLKHTVVKVPEWDGEIRLRELSAADGAEAMRYANGNLADDPTGAVRAAAWMVARSWVDEVGERVLDDEEGVDDLLKTQRSDLLFRLSSTVMELSGLVPGALETAAKNSESSQSDDSGTN